MPAAIAAIANNGRYTHPNCIALHALKIHCMTASFEPLPNPPLVCQLDTQTIPMSTKHAGTNPTSCKSCSSQSGLPADSKIARFNLGLPFNKDIENANTHFLSTFTSMWTAIRNEDPTVKLVPWADPFQGKHIEEPNCFHPGWLTSDSTLLLSPLPPTELTALTLSSAVKKIPLPLPWTGSLSPPLFMIGYPNTVLKQEKQLATPKPLPTPIVHSTWWSFRDSPTQGP
jgi:hypothetical protein